MMPSLPDPREAQWLASLGGRCIHRSLTSSQARQMCAHHGIDDAPSATEADLIKPPAGAVSKLPLLSRPCCSKEIICSSPSRSQVAVRRLTSPTRNRSSCSYYSCSRAIIIPNRASGPLPWK
ncbi:hypothetical protein GUJ93_ZPchr0001g29297 [Zizania palustris]|uniref:Uncharacterized protein n=1 Tax=Zizania palustris TaxID=103762 RepID=A0A8J5VDE5_ZIZPA|nr:hypothetical protein GUJ93_ZPchr0001g29297 [Zizania palustris]